MSDGLPALLSVRGLCVQFGTQAALDDVSFEIAPGETVGLVGESGSGKSTLARAILRLTPAAGGVVDWRGIDLLRCGRATLRRLRRDLQIVFQDPLSSLDPRMTVGRLLAEPLEIFEPALDPLETGARVAQMLERVGLGPSSVHRYPHEFSGGQCQRISIARAMMLRPALLICDEPVSSLDVSIQGQIVNLLGDLQREFGTAMLLISHNLAVVRHLSHRVMVIFQGRIVEVAQRDVLFAAPRHPYTRALLAAVPDPIRLLAAAAAGATAAGAATPERATPGVRAPGVATPGALLQSPAVPLPRSAPAASGCAYRDRCAHADRECGRRRPVLEALDDRHAVACHHGRDLVYS